MIILEVNMKKKKEEALIEGLVLDVSGSLFIMSWEFSSGLYQVDQ